MSEQSSEEIIIDTTQQQTQEVTDEIEEIVNSSSQFATAINAVSIDKTVQAEPSRFNLAVVAKERK